MAFALDFDQCLEYKYNGAHRMYWPFYLREEPPSWPRPGIADAAAGSLGARSPPRGRALMRAKEGRDEGGGAGQGGGGRGGASCGKRKSRLSGGVMGMTVPRSGSPPSVHLGHNLPCLFSCLPSLRRKLAISIAVHPLACFGLQWPDYRLYLDPECRPPAFARPHHGAHIITARHHLLHSSPRFPSHPLRFHPISQRCVLIALPSLVLMRSPALGRPHSSTLSSSSSRTLLAAALFGAAQSALDRAAGLATGFLCTLETLHILFSLQSSLLSAVYTLSLSLLLLAASSALPALACLGVKYNSRPSGDSNVPWADRS
ncbi:hypothetical protein Mapa_012304 [Marchantia paleacea]|nr:hypothetical protein Mapa_012304 [Marchantia paleacea]